MTISKKRAKEIDAIKDSEIDTSDIPEFEEEFWENAVLEFPVKKKYLGIRVDEDVLFWFKEKGKGYQTRINAILRTYMNAHNRG